MTHPIPTETFLPTDETPILSSRRQDGWSAANQRLFLEALAEGHGVEAATYRVGLSAASAYAFRRTAKGAAFALGWRAASLVARDAIAETLLVRALEGTVDTVTRGDTVITRHRYDNRLALSLLARLDRQIEVAADADIKAARLVAQEFDAFLDLVARDEGPARAGLFLARRSGGLGDGQGEADARDLAPIYALAAADRLVRTGVATADEVDIADLDPAARATWTADQWSRAEAAGLLTLAAPAPIEQNAPAPQHSQHSPSVEEPRDPVWWCEYADAWRTSFPPPDDFDGEEDGKAGEDGYERELTPDEHEIVEQPYELEREAAVICGEQERDAWFAAVAVEAPPREEAGDPFNSLCTDLWPQQEGESPTRNEIPPSR